MFTGFHDWLVFLQRADTLISFPLLVSGAALLFFGWHMWKICVALSYGLIGAGIGMTLVGSGDQRWTAALLCGAALCLVGYGLAKHAVVVLGGLIGASIAVCIMNGMHIRGLPLLLVSVVVFILATAVSLSNRRLLMIGVTAAMGAALALSGVTALMMLSPSLYSTFSSLASGNGLLVVFILSVPTVVSCFYQVAEVRRAGVQL